jgi:endonuclease III
MRESKVKLKERVLKVNNLLIKNYPESKCALDFKSAHQLLVATILSAQCTDKRVNIVTKDLFKKYKSVKDFSSVSQNELAVDIHSCGYYNQKSRSIISASRILIEEHGGRMPDTMAELQALPGVGRKTANCVLGTWFGQPAMVVDTHMIRILNLLGFVREKDPVKIEKLMMALLPDEFWVSFTHRIIDHGRAVCIARRPACDNCCLRELCPGALPTGKTK